MHPREPPGPQDGSGHRSTRRSIFEEFSNTEIGRELDHDARATLASIRFLGARLPTVRTYQAIALALVGSSTRPAAEVLAELGGK